MIFSEAPADSSLVSAPILDRRRVIGGLGLASLGLLISSNSASAFTSAIAPQVNVQTHPSNISRPSSERIDLRDLPPEWAQHQGSALSEYARYLWGLRLRSISAAQVIDAHAKCKSSVWNMLPPKQWWTRMGYTLRVADRIALEMNISQVEVVSAYRCPAYNSHCEGAKVGSWHQANVAVDVKFPVKASQVTAAARDLRDRGLFKGGVGGYWDFTHIDTRGMNVNWQA